MDCVFLFQHAHKNEYVKGKINTKNPKAVNADFLQFYMQCIYSLYLSELLQHLFFEKIRLYKIVDDLIYCFRMPLPTL